MNTSWSLDSLYKGFDDEKYIEDYRALENSIEMLNEFAAKLNEKSVEENLVRYIEISEKQRELFSKLFIYANLRQSTNTKDIDSASYIGRLQAMLSETTKSVTLINKYIASIDNLDELINKNPLLKEYEYMLNCIKSDDKYILGEEVEEAIAKLDISGGSAWGDLQAYLTSTVKVDYDGGTTTLSAIRNLAYSRDAKVRRNAYEAEIASYDKIKDAIAFALNSIKLQVTNVSKLRGFESPLAETLYGARMKKETLDALFEAIDEYLPKFHEYLRVKAEVLGYKNGLPWYDLFAPMGSNDKKYTVEEARDYLITHFESFAPDLAQMVTRAFDEAWIDFYPKDGKVGGAFCCGIYPIKESRVLTNFDGNFGDIVTLAHELGHAYHNMNTETHRIMNTDYSMPVAETASTFNENIIVNAAIKETNDDVVKLSLIEGQLQDATQIICDIYSRFLFESKVFENREKSFMFPDELSEIMLDAQKKAYGDGLDSDVLHPYMWVCKSHYYGSDVSFYNFPYAFGGLFARGLYAMYEEEGEEFLPKYRKLLYSTTIMSVEDVAMTVGIDLTDKNFWRKGLESYAKQIDMFKKLVNK